MRISYKEKFFGVLMAALILMGASPGFANLLPEGSFEWPLDNPEGEYEQVTPFSPNTAIPALGGWKANASSVYLEIFKVRGIYDIVFPVAAPDSGENYITLGSYNTNIAFALYSDPITLEAGKTYQVSGYVSSAYALGNNTGTWTVSLGDTSVTGDLSLLQRDTWTPFSFTYVAGVDSPSMRVGWTKTAIGHARVMFDGLSVIQAPVMSPVFSPDDSYISGPTEVTISSATEGASIYYTLNGETPTTGSYLYDGPVIVNIGDTLKAIAVKAGYSDSSVTNQTYLYRFANLLPAEYFEWAPDNPESEYQQVTPFSPNTAIPALGGWKANASSVYLEIFKVRGIYGIVFPTAEPTSGYNYLTLGSYNTNNAFALYSDPITLEAGKTYQVSGYVSSNYPLGNNTGTWTVSLGDTSTTGDLALLQRDIWTPFSFTYVAGVDAPSMRVEWIKTAIGHARVMFDGLSVTEVMQPSDMPPILSPSEKYISGPTTVTITSPVEGASIYYTTNGDPAITSETPHSSPVSVTVDDGMTLRAVSVVDGYSQSVEVCKKYVVHGIPVVAWYGIPESSSTLENYQILKDAGFTHNLSYTYTSLPSVGTALDYAYEAGVKLITNRTGPSSDHFIERFKNHPAFEAYFLKDEPVASDFASLAGYIADIEAVDDDHWCYINLLPMGSTFANVAEYENYVDSFLDIVPVKVLSFDQYPILTSGIRSDFYSNLEIISSAAKVEGIPFWGFALSSAHNDYPVPTLTHLRFQMFSNLAYGAQGLQYFTYWYPPAPGDPYTDSPVDSTGQPTATWYVVQDMNEEIRGLSPVFKDAQVVRLGHTGSSLPAETTQYTPVAPIQSLTTLGSDGAIVSELTNGENNYLVVVNRDIINTMTLNLSVDITKNLSRVFKDGSVTALPGGTVSYTVEPADIVILKWENAPLIPGDANDDGAVDVGDLGILAANYGGTGKSWSEGDFNGDGAVDVGDLGILAANYGTGSSSADWAADYDQTFEMTVTDSAEEENVSSSICAALGLPLIMGLLLVGLMLVKLEDK